MPGKELRDDLSKEENEEKRGERTIKTSVRWVEGGRKDNVKAIRKRKGQEDGRAEAKKRVGRDWSVMRTSPTPSSD